MTAHELTLKTNRFLLSDGTLIVPQREYIVRRLLESRSAREEAECFYRGVRCPGNVDQDGRRMYPLFYIPPYNNGKKLKTIIN